MLSIADLKIAVIGSDYVPSALDLDKSDEKKLIFLIRCADKSIFLCKFA